MVYRCQFARRLRAFNQEARSPARTASAEAAARGHTELGADGGHGGRVLCRESEVTRGRRGSLHDLLDGLCPRELVERWQFARTVNRRAAQQR